MVLFLKTFEGSCAPASPTSTQLPVAYKHQTSQTIKLHYPSSLRSSFYLVHLFLVLFSLNAFFLQDMRKMNTLNTRRNGNDFYTLASTESILLIWDLQVVNQNCSYFGEIIIGRLYRKSVDFPHVFNQTLLEYVHI